MYANLMGQKAYHRLSDDDMARILGISRQAYAQKAKSGRFYPEECKKLCEYFGKSFSFLFARNDEID